MTSSGRSSSRPTLEQVAALAGVSRGTASRVLSGASNVSDAAVEAVRRAAAELHYRPNLAARSLVTGRTGLVGLLVNEPQHKLWTDPFFGELARGAHDRLAEEGVALILSLATEESERDKLVEKYGEAQALFESLGGYGLEARAHEVLAGLGFSPEQVGGDNVNVVVLVGVDLANG